MCYVLQGMAILSLSSPNTISFKITLDRNFDPADQLQSVLLSVPAFINSSAMTLGALVGHNAPNMQVV
jgi:hypothetical protein